LRLTRIDFPWYSYQGTRKQEVTSSNSQYHFVPYVLTGFIENAV